MTVCIRAMGILLREAMDVSVSAYVKIRSSVADVRERGAGGYLMD